MTDKHDQARPNAQAEARAIVSAYFKGSSAYDDSALVKDIATALAAKDAELAKLDALFEERSLEVNALFARAERAEAQLAEANKAVDELESAAQRFKGVTQEYFSDTEYDRNGVLADADATLHVLLYNLSAARRIRSALATPVAPDPAPDVVAWLHKPTGHVLSARDFQTKLPELQERFTETHSPEEIEADFLPLAHAQAGWRSMDSGDPICTTCASGHEGAIPTVCTCDRPLPAAPGGQ